MREREASWIAPALGSAPGRSETSGAAVGRPNSARACSHTVQFYERDEFLYRVLADHFTAGQDGGEPMAMFATEAHRRGFLEHLRAMGLPVDRLRESGQLVLFDAEDTLAKFMVGGAPDPARFTSHVGGLLDQLYGRSRFGRVRAYGEMVDVLWKRGNSQGTLQLERLWNELARGHCFSLLCGYAIGGMVEPADDAAFAGLCDTHGALGAETTGFEALSPSAQLMELGRLRQRAQALEGEIAHRKQLEQVLRDALAERERAEEALRASQRDMVDFLENAVEGFHKLGPDGTILSVNQAELDFLGYARSEYVGHPLAKFHADPRAAADILARLGRRETLRDYEARLICRDGSARDVLVYANAFFRGDALDHARCFTRDITERRRLENELRRQNQELSSTVRFSEMFVGILGHDLRNPLSAITTAASLLTRRSSSEDVTRPAKRILNSAGRMGRMIDQLLDFTRIRLGRGIPLQQRPTDLDAICRTAIEEFESTGEAPRFQLVTAGDPVGLWDGDRLLQLVSNLFGNALRHGQPHGMVRVRIDGHDRAVTVLEVQNLGAVPPELVPVLFEPLRSAENEKAEGSNGLGLGLFISQQIALAHGGTIAVFSSDADGTRLVVTLPRAAPASHAVFRAAGGPA